MPGHDTSPEWRGSRTVWQGFQILTPADACAKTGLTLEEINAIPGVEELSRQLDGVTELVLRVPSELVDAAAVDVAAVREALEAPGGHADLRQQIREITGPPVPRWNRWNRRK